MVRGAVSQGDYKKFRVEAAIAIEHRIAGSVVSCSGKVGMA